MFSLPKLLGFAVVTAPIALFAAPALARPHELVAPSGYDMIKLSNGGYYLTEHNAADDPTSSTVTDHHVSKTKSVMHSSPILSSSHSHSRDSSHAYAVHKTASTSSSASIGSSHYRFTQSGTMTMPTSHITSAAKPINSLYAASYARTHPNSYMAVAYPVTSWTKTVVSSTTYEIPAMPKLFFHNNELHELLTGNRWDPQNMTDESIADKAEYLNRALIYGAISAKQAQKLVDSETNENAHGVMRFVLAAYNDAVVKYGNDVYGPVRYGHTTVTNTVTGTPTSIHHSASAYASAAVDVSYNAFGHGGKTTSAARHTGSPIAAYNSLMERHELPADYPSFPVTYFIKALRQGSKTKLMPRHTAVGSGSPVYTYHSLMAHTLYTRNTGWEVCGTDKLRQDDCSEDSPDFLGFAAPGGPWGYDTTPPPALDTVPASSSATATVSLVDLDNGSKTTLAPRHVIIVKGSPTPSYRSLPPRSAHTTGGGSNDCCIGEGCHINCANNDGRPHVITVSHDGPGWTTITGTRTLAPMVTHVKRVYVPPANTGMMWPPVIFPSKQMWPSPPSKTIPKLKWTPTTTVDWLHD